MLADGTAKSRFNDAFALQTAAQYSGEAVATAPAINFVERHTAIPPLQEEVNLRDFPDWKLVHTVADRTEAAAPANPSTEDCKVQYSIFFISRANVARLKKKMTSTNFQPSLVETLSAFLWMCTVRARNVDADYYPETKLSVPVDTRGRMLNSDICSNYWGNMGEPNAVARLPTKFLAGQNVSTAKQASVWDVVLPEAAKRIRNSINVVDSKAVQRLTALLNQMPKATSLTWNVDRWPGPDMLMICLHRIQYLNFGPGIGKAVAYRSTIGLPGVPDGRCLVLPSRPGDDGGLEILIQYDTETLQRLKQDSEFSEFFEWRN